jgi:ATPase subunit of ABC transporter with duplicated ATPase domains
MTLYSDAVKQRAQEREKLERVQAAEQAERDKSNAKTRQEFLAALAEKKAQAHAKSQAEVDLQLEPEKNRVRNSWLANHPRENSDDFEEVWKKHLRENAFQDLSRQIDEQIKARLRASGDYQW